MRSSVYRFGKAVSVFLISVLFTSCIDYVQSISYKDGRYRIYYKITLSKVLLAFGDMDTDEIFGSFEDEIMEGLPQNIQLQRIDTDLEVGAEFSVVVHPKTSDENEKAVLPEKKGNAYYIPLLFSDTDGFDDSMSFDEDDEEEAVALAMLSSAKGRILVSKKIVPNIKAAYFEGRGAENYAVPVFDYGNSFCAEFPFILFLKSDMYKFDKLVLE